MFKKYNKALISTITIHSVMLETNETFGWIDLVFFFFFMLPVKAKKKSCNVDAINLMVKTNQVIKLCM